MFGHDMGLESEIPTIKGLTFVNTIPFQGNLPRTPTVPLETSFILQKCIFHVNVKDDALILIRKLLQHAAYI